MHYPDFANVCYKAVIEFEREHVRYPEKKHAYLGYEDYAELMNTLCPGMNEITKEWTKVNGFMIFQVDVKRHFELLVR